MKKNYSHTFVFTTLCMVGASLFSSCSNDDDETNIPAEATFGSGIYVTNEGGFGKSDGDVSFINRTSKTVEPAIFKTTNGRPAGDVIQSMAFHNGKAYIVAKAGLRSQFNLY